MRGKGPMDQQILYNIRDHQAKLEEPVPKALEIMDFWR